MLILVVYLPPATVSAVISWYRHVAVTTTEVATEVVTEADPPPRTTAGGGVDTTALDPALTLPVSNFYITCLNCIRHNFDFKKVCTEFA